MTEQELNEMLNNKVKEKKEEALKVVSPVEMPLAVEADKTKPNEIVDGMFNQAIGHVATSDKDIQVKILETAKGYIENKTDAIKSDVEKENKTAFFQNNEDACGSYGFNEKTTPKWAVIAMRYGYNIMVALWILIGTFTFMPVSFICKKMSVIIKNVWLAVVLSILIWLATIIIPILIPIITNL